MCKKDCGCNEVPCITPDCSCKVFISTDCITNTEDLLCSNILKGQTLTEVITQLDAYICDRFESVENFLQIVNVGTGSEIYKGISVLGKKEFRSLVDSNLINIAQNADEITISVNEDILTSFIDNLAPPIPSLQQVVNAGNSVMDAEVMFVTASDPYRYVTVGNFGVTGGRLGETFAITEQGINFNNNKNILPPIPSSEDVNFKLPTKLAGTETFAMLSDLTGAETKINAGTGISKTGIGTTASPYVINATLGLAEVITNNNELSNTYVKLLPAGYLTVSADASPDIVGSLTINNSTSQVAGTMKAQIGTNSSLGGSILRFLTDRTEFDDLKHSKGIEYFGDYEPNFTDRSLVTKQYVLSVLPALPDGSETKISPGTGITISGIGTTASPYLVSSVAGNTLNQGWISTVDAGSGTVGAHYTVGGDIIDAVIVSQNSGYNIIGCTMANAMPNTSYRVAHQIESLGGDQFHNSRLFGICFTVYSTTYFEVAVAEPQNDTQSIKLHLQVIKY